jgi:hypothetical protein
MDALDLAMRDGWSAPSVHLGVAPAKARAVSSDVRLDPEAVADRLLEVVFRGFERRAERAAVLERMRHVAQLRDDDGVLSDRVEHAAVAAEAGLVEGW